MKIVFLASAASVHSHKWINYFASKGHQVYWLSLTPPSYEIMPSIRFIEVSSKSKAISIIKATILLKKLIKQELPDIVHAHYAGTYGLIGALSGFENFFTTVWGSDILFAGREFGKRIFIKYILSCSKIITCDAYHMIEALKALGVEDNKIKIIYFGIDTKRFRPIPKDAAIVKSWNCESSDFLVISLRNFEPVYDVETLIRAIPLVLVRVPNAKFLIAGSGRQEDYLKSLAKDLSVDGQVRFLGKYDNTKLPAYLCSTDAYVSTSLSDAGIAASTAEAMACGVPVIVTDSGENNLWIKDGENGFIVPVKSPEILAERIIALAKDREIARKFGAAGREIIVEKNDYSTEMQKMEYCYEQFIAKNLL